MAKTGTMLVIEIKVVIKMQVGKIDLGGGKNTGAKIRNYTKK